MQSQYKEFLQACHRITEGDPLSQELAHYVLAQFLERADAQDLVERGEAWYMCLRITTNSWKSTTSPFYRMYRQPQIALDSLPDRAEEIPDSEEPDLEALAQQVQTHLKDLGWYERELLHAYAEHNSNALALSKSTGIPRTSISLTIKKIRTHVKSSL